MHPVAHGPRQRHHVGGGGAAAVGQRQRVLSGQPTGPFAGESPAEASLFDQPARGEFHPVRCRVVRDRGLDAGLYPLELVNRHHRVGEERSDADGVGVGRVEHHALSGAQRQHRRANLSRISTGAEGHPEGGGEFGVAQRCRKSPLVQRELHLEHDRLGGVFERAVPVAEIQFPGRHPAHVAGGPVQKFHPGHRVGHLDPVGANVLHRRGTRRTRYAGKAFKATEVGIHGHADDMVPVGTGTGAQHSGLRADRGIGHPHDGQVGEIVGDDHVGSTTEHQHRAVMAVQFPQGGDDVGFGHAVDHPPRDRADPQRGQRGQWDVVIDLRATKLLPRGHAR